MKTISRVILLILSVGIVGSCGESKKPVPQSPNSEVPATSNLTPLRKAFIKATAGVETQMSAFLSTPSLLDFSEDSVRLSKLQNLPFELVQIEIQSRPLNSSGAATYTRYFATPGVVSAADQNLSRTSYDPSKDIVSGTLSEVTTAPTTSSLDAVKISKVRFSRRWDYSNVQGVSVLTHSDSEFLDIQSKSVSGQLSRGALIEDSSDNNNDLGFNPFSFLSSNYETYFNINGKYASLYEGESWSKKNVGVYGRLGLAWMNASHPLIQRNPFTKNRNDQRLLLVIGDFILVQKSANLDANSKFEVPADAPIYSINFYYRVAETR